MTDLAAPSTVSAAPARSLRRTIRILRSQLLVEQRIFWRNPSNVIFTVAFPLLLLAFLGVFADPELLVPGIAALVIVSTAFQGLAIQLAMHRDQGVLKRIMGTPLTPGLLVAGKVVSIALVAVLEVAIVVAMGVGLYDVPLPVAPAAFLLAVLLGVATFVVLGFAVAALTPSGDAAPALVNAIYLPMMFISGIFYELDKLPLAGQWIAQLLPLAHLVEPMRSAWLGGWAGGQAWLHLLVLGAWLVGGLVVVVRWFRWEPAHER
jgi:ABC-2 type transport system permease protein